MYGSSLSKRGVKLVDGFLIKEDYNEEHCVFWSTTFE